MKKIVASVLIDRPVEAAWKFVADLSNIPKWQAECVEMKQTSSGPAGVGATFLYRRATNPKINDARIIGYEPNRQVTLEFTSGLIKGSTGNISLETVEGKTRLTETDDYKLGGLYSLLTPFMGGQAKRNAEAHVGNLKRILESEKKS